ncbi:hypothetical protein C8Q73DRAFT_192464 [Cubamyces lactineus]|nr:hypothetical protein C8Q73DRAFT_192464 [Cubamyces lactineus]
MPLRGQDRRCVMFRSGQSSSIVQRLVVSVISTRFAPPPSGLSPSSAGSGFDYLINNAGIVRTSSNSIVWTCSTLRLFSNPSRRFRTPRSRWIRRNSYVACEQTSLGLRSAQICLPFLDKSERKVILNVSSTGGSIATAESVGAKMASYCISKTALNMLKAERPEITTIALCPGHVKTDMGGQEAELEPEQSVSGILKLITSASQEHSGKYLRYYGEVIPW